MAENLRVVAAVSRASAEAPSHIVTSGCLIQDFFRLSLGQPRILCAQWRPLPRMSATKRNTDFSWCSIPSSDRSNEHWTMVRLRMSVVLDQRATLSDFSSPSTVRLSSMFFTSVFLHTSELRNTACEEFGCHTHGNATCSQCQRRTWRSSIGSQDPAASLLTALPRCLAMLAGHGFHSCFLRHPNGLCGGT